MQVISLNAEVHQAKAKPLATRDQRAPYLDKKVVLAQRRQPSPNAQRDMQRMALRMRGPPQMRHSRPPPFGLSTRPHTRPAPRAEMKCPLHFKWPPHWFHLAPICRTPTST